MSTDNWIAVIKEGRKYVGYNCSNAVNYWIGRVISLEKVKREGIKVFEVTSLKKAILEVLKRPTEYGYEFVNLEEEE